MPTIRLAFVLILTLLMQGEAWSQAASSKTPLDEARELAGRGNHSAALARFDQAIAQKELEAPARAGKAASLMALDRHEEAQGEIDTALKLDQKEPGYHMLAGRLALIRNDIESARKHYDRAASVAPKKAGAIYMDLASALSARRDDKLAGQIESALKAAAAANPPSLDALFSLGQSYVAAGRPEGKTHLQRFLDEQNRLPEKERDANRVRLAKQMIRALDTLKSVK